MICHGPYPVHAVTLFLAHQAASVTIPVRGPRLKEHINCVFLPLTPRPSLHFPFTASPVLTSTMKPVTKNLELKFTKRANAEEVYCEMNDPDDSGSKLVHYVISRDEDAKTISLFDHLWDVPVRMARVAEISFQMELLGGITRRLFKDTKRRYNPDIPTLSFHTEQ